jgi:hypothetical protein
MAKPLVVLAQIANTVNIVQKMAELVEFVDNKKLPNFLFPNA